jgi:hypothetical protein
MDIIKFRCRLLSDVIINYRAATEGNQETLDFIPGSSFLGVAARDLYKATSEENFVIFHSGKIRFGDAHPIYKTCRAVRVPSSLYSPKGFKITDKALVHHLLPENGLKENVKPIQLKQAREGYITKNQNDENSAFYFTAEKSFSIKSAFDRLKRRAMDARMYGYEAMSKGMEMGFEVSFDKDLAPEIRQKVINALLGHRSIGRSSNAQYGLVEISQENYEDSFTSFDFQNGLLIYAESRLAFRDAYGQLTLIPTAQDLGVTHPDAYINWSKSQVRTFHYAPYNSTRKQRDADRIGIEKGSVLYIEGATIKDLAKNAAEKGVGIFINEGFGRIIVNPSFLKAEGNNARSIFSYIRLPEATAETEAENTEVVAEHDKILLDFLKQQKQLKQNEQDTYRKVNEFIEQQNIRQWRGMASQWGSIRMKAMVNTDKQKLYDALFKEPEGYLVHGVAKEKWEGKKLNDLKNFFKEQLSHADNNTTQKVIINLAAEMAKQIQRKEANNA